MNAIHVGRLDVEYGGPSLSTYLTIKGLEESGINVSMVMAQLHDEQRIIGGDINIKLVPKIVEAKFGFIRKLDDYLNVLEDNDIIHIQGLWYYLNHKCAKYAKKKKIPYVMTLRGMLYPQALSHSRIVKQLSLYIYQAADLRNAACVQATCIEEMEHYRNLGFKNPVAVIPNPIEVRGKMNSMLPIKNTFRIGYLGRVHPRKRIERLIYAFDTLKNRLPKNAELLIIGAGDDAYLNFLQNEVKRLGLINVTFTGFLTGEAKDRAIDSLSLLVVPSDFENFGNIVTEALVHGVPVIASKGMPWRELAENKCGWWVDNDQATINKTIIEAYSVGCEELRTMGLNGRELMHRAYSVQALGEKMKSLYEWILGNASKPDFVYDN